MRKATITLALALLLCAVASGSAAAKGGPGHGHGAGTVTPFAAGFNNPRGLTFGPDGFLYVAEGGLGGSDSTVGQCPQVVPPVGPYTGSTNDPVRGGRISKVSPAGVVSTVVSALPSSQTGPGLGGLVSGVADTAFVGHTLYGLLAGAGCSHGVATVPNGIIRVGSGGTWTLVANLSAFQQSHPVAHPNAGDFEPDGTWYDMVALGRALYAVEPNHGEIDRITPSGAISRVLDVSAVLGHAVPTVLAVNGLGHANGDHGRGHHSAQEHGRHGHAALYFANLGEFGPDDGPTPNESVWKLAGHSLHVRASGLEQVLGLTFLHGSLYALESSSTPGGPTPGSGQIVRIDGHGGLHTVVSGLVFPTGLTAGPDGALYVSEQGFGFPAGAGSVVKVTLH